MGKTKQTNGKLLKNMLGSGVLIGEAVFEFHSPRGWLRLFMRRSGACPFYFRFILNSMPIPGKYTVASYILVQGRTSIDSAP
jgi:hypothetical protein